MKSSSKASNKAQKSTQNDAQELGQGVLLSLLNSFEIKNLDDVPDKVI